MPNMHIKYSKTMINLAHNYYVIEELDKTNILLESKRKGGNKCSEKILCPRLQSDKLELNQGFHGFKASALLPSRLALFSFSLQALLFGTAEENNLISGCFSHQDPPRRRCPNFSATKTWVITSDFARMELHPGSHTETQASDSEHTIIPHSFNNSRMEENNDMGNLK